MGFLFKKIVLLNPFISGGGIFGFAVLPVGDKA